MPRISLNTQAAKQFIRPFVPVGLLDLMARRHYEMKAKLSAQQRSDNNATPTPTSENVASPRSATAIIFYWSHLFGTTEALATFAKNALIALEVDVTMVNIDAQADLEVYADAGTNYDFAISVGSLPLAKRVAGRPLYEVFGENFYLWVLDPIIYDLQKFLFVRQYLNASQRSSRLRFLFWERDYANLVTELTSPEQVRYFPFGGHFYVPSSSTDDVARIPRLAIIGTVGAELAKVSSSDLDGLATSSDTPNVSSALRSRYFDAIESVGGNANVTMVARDVLGIEVKQLLSVEWLPFLTRVDSYEKRRRRLLVAAALRGIPVDFYGTGWKEHVPPDESFQFLDAVSFNAQPRLLRRYRGLVNFDPNLEDGLHDRVYTALGNGCRVITNTNRATVEVDAPHGTLYTYDINAPELADSAAEVLNAANIPDHDILALRRNHCWQSRVDAVFTFPDEHGGPLPVSAE
jgi:hypothetical protein